MKTDLPKPILLKNNFEVLRDKVGCGASRLAHMSYLAARRAGGSRSKENRGSTDTSR